MRCLEREERLPFQHGMVDIDVALDDGLPAKIQRERACQRAEVRPCFWFVQQRFQRASQASAIARGYQANGGGVCEQRFGRVVMRCHDWQAVFEQGQQRAAFERDAVIEGQNADVACAEPVRNFLIGQVAGNVNGLAQPRFCDQRLYLGAIVLRAFTAQSQTFNAAQEQQACSRVALPQCLKSSQQRLQSFHRVQEAEEGQHHGVFGPAEASAQHAPRC